MGDYSEVDWAKIAKVDVRYLINSLRLDYENFFSIMNFLVIE